MSATGGEGERKNKNEEKQKKNENNCYRQRPSVGGRVARKGAVVDGKGRGGVVDRAAAVGSAESEKEEERKREESEGETVEKKKKSSSRVAKARKLFFKKKKKKKKKNHALESKETFWTPSDVNISSEPPPKKPARLRRTTPLASVTLPPLF